jgi:hypothetical protein
MSFLPHGWVFGMIAAILLAASLEKRHRFTAWLFECFAILLLDLW